MFDLKNVNIDFDVIIKERPIKTKSGKVPLKVNNIYSNSKGDN